MAGDEPEAAPSPAPRTAPATQLPPARAAAAPPPPPAPSPAAPATAPVDEQELSRRVMADLQRQLDLMLEVRLREALKPALARTADALVRDARLELTRALREAVDTAVRQASAAPRERR